MGADATVLATTGAQQFASTWRRIARLLCCAVLAFASAIPVAADPWDEPPINYRDAEANNRVSRLIQRLEREPNLLYREGSCGYLKSLLSALEVPVSSQALVFSKTSLQRERINPQTPRAVYFHDDVYVGYCQEGEVLEVSAADPQLGAVFYTLDQQGQGASLLKRQGDSCLLCHSSNNTQGVPGHLVRSVYADASGLPRLSLGSHVTDHTSPWNERWGGWFVTGRHGTMQHLGNFIADHHTEVETVDNAAGLNVTDLSSRIDCTAYLSPHSDLVALLVLEHQTQMHNLITRANFETRRALFQETQLNSETDQPAGHRWESTTRRIQSVCEPLLRHLLLVGEPALASPVEGTSPFASEFAQRGPHDARGRSLYQFDLQTRVFRFPCSYLIYSEAFAALPDEARHLVLSRLGQVLSGQTTDPHFAHLTAADRRAIWEILSATLADLPGDWANYAPATSG